MYYTGVDPRNMKPVYVPKNPHEKAMQRALIQYRDPKNYDLVMEALRKSGRMDLVGFDQKCLIKPRKIKSDMPGVKRKQNCKNSKNVKNNRGGNNKRRKSR